MVILSHHRQPINEVVSSDTLVTGRGACDSEALATGSTLAIECRMLLLFIVSSWARNTGSIRSRYLPIKDDPLTACVQMTRESYSPISITLREGLALLHFKTGPFNV